MRFVIVAVESLRPKASPASRKTKSSQRALKVVGIGASAGGLEAFTELVRELSVGTGIGYVLVQHLDPTHSSLLAELLGKATTLPVLEIQDGMVVEPDRIHVIPPNCDLTIENGVLRLATRGKNAGPARSIDHFLLSLALDQKENAVGVILSGAGSDGAEGLRAIKEAGGITFAQDNASAKYDSMPRSAVGTGCVDFVLSPAKIASELAGLIKRPGKTRSRAAANARDRRSVVQPKLAPPIGIDGRDGAIWPAPPEDINLRKIFLLLRTRTGIDFGLYRLNTIRRRLARRISLHKLKGLEPYVRFLREHPPEIEALYQDLLINVTSFFRNPSVFDAMQRRIFPRLLKNNAGSGDPLRVWVAGCSTGQEPYSIAMAYTEFAEKSGTHVPIQIFASDINPTVLDHARAGRYTRAQVQGIPAARLHRFFTRDHEFYCVQKPIREMVIFAQQNLLSDPPFTRVDLITCRNLLIYLEPALQQRIIPAFHYALKPNGVLVLGTSESIGPFATLFEPMEKAQKVYLKKPAANWVRYERPPAAPVTKALRVTPGYARPSELNTLDAFKEADRVTLSKYCPVSVLVTEDGEILQFRGDVHRYLELPSGKASFQLFKMAREGLALPLQKAFQRAKRDNKPVRERGIRFDRRRGVVNLEVVPLRNLNARCYLVLFEKPPTTPKAEPVDGNGTGRGRNGHNGNGVDGNHRELQQLRHEYAETREHLVSLQEQHNTSIEELQASNEEVQSANEELQSLNEELETSNEELESANEELTTLNEELATRNTELRESEHRLREQAELLEMAPVLARSPKDRIIFWNRGAEKLYGFSKDEAIGQTSHFLLRAQFSEPQEKIEKELLRRGHWEGEVLHRRKDGQVICVATQWVVHRDASQKVRAVLEVNTDITQRKQAEKALRQSEEFNRSILESSPDSIKVLDLAGRVLFMSPAGMRLMEMRDFKQAANAYWPAFWAGEHRAVAENAYRSALSGETVRFRGLCATKKGTPRWWDVVVQPISGADGRPERILVVKRDITEQRMSELSREEEARLATLRAEIAFAVARAGDSQPIFQEIADTLRHHMRAAAARIWVQHRGTPQLELQASTGLENARGAAMPRSDSPAKIEQVAMSKTPMLVNDMAAEPEAFGIDREWAQGVGVVSFASYPLLFENDVLGVVAIYGREPWEPRILTELSLASDAIAQFVDRKAAEEERGRLLEEATRSRAEVEVLNEIGRTLAAELDLQKLTQAVTDAATRLAGAEFGIFYFNTTDDRRGDYGLHALSGIDPEVFERVPLPAKTAVFTPALTEKRVVRCDDVTTDPQCAQDETHAGLPIDRLPVKSYLAVPVISRSGEVIGALFFGHSSANVFGDRAERLVVNLAAQAAIAMDNARLVDQLERKVTERTARLQETISELQAFSYTVSHDLRAPLRAMQGYAQVLVQDCADQLDSTAREYLSRIEHAGMRLDRLIQDVLTYSRIARAQVALQPLDLVTLLRDIINQYPMLQPPAAEIEIHEPFPLVLAEESSATQCFSNLLGNAVKFVPKDRRPRISIRAEPAGEFTRVWVEDNGIGIAEKDYERIFKMFERVESAKGYEGTGIGLAIVRKAIERMGGRAGVDSHPGQGSHFWLEFKNATA